MSALCREVIAVIRTAVGPDYPIVLRVSQWKQQDLKARLAHTPAAMADWLVPLVEAGVDIVHCSQRRFWEPEFPEIDGADGLNFAGWAQRLTGAATISVGSVGLSGDFIGVFQNQVSAPTDLDALVRRMERGEFDLIAVGRALITDPDWANTVRMGNVAGMLPFAAAAVGAFV
ncbi:FMN reductase [Sphingomonas sp. R86520]|uniref:FMN reductase n=1 Tax=Sphingomonas sp. R86520 TaxID=3093859 RepID=UPI0036D3040C